MKKYTKDHEWLEQSTGTCYKVGITNYAQEQLGDIVLVELPEVGSKVTAGEDLVVIESVKAASDVYAPVSGEVIAVNEQVVDSPTIVNEAAESKGWLVTIDIQSETDLAGLMDEESYNKFINENE